MSDYYLTDEHRQLRESVRAFAQAEIRPHVQDMENARALAPELSRHIARQGWLGATISPVHGGMGAGHVAKTVILQEVSKVCAAMGAMLQASQLGAAKIIHFGSAEQRQAWLPGIAAGTILPTIAVTEPGNGGHLLGMAGTAVRDGDSYVLNGHKVHVGNSVIGDVHGVVLRTGPGSRGLSAFLVEREREGLHVQEHRQSLGLHGFGFGELTLDNCRVPAANLLGAEGDGLDVAYSSSTLYGRPNLTAVALGIHQNLVQETVQFCKERQRYGAPLWKLGVIKDRLGRMQNRLMTARLSAYHAVHLLDVAEQIDKKCPDKLTGYAADQLAAEGSCDPELMSAKLTNVEYALDSARDAMDIHAAAGLFAERAVERCLRDAHALAAPAGTSDIQRLRLAETALGVSAGSYSARIRPAA